MGCAVYASRIVCNRRSSPTSRHDRWLNGLSGWRIKNVFTGYRGHAANHSGKSDPSILAVPLFPVIHIESQNN
jgi:hypothetical protein